MTRHWRDTAAGTEVEFWLATDDGPRHLRLGSHPSVAFIPAEQRAQAELVLRGEPSCELRPLALNDFQHRPVLGLYCAQYRQLQKQARRLRDNGVDVYEADVRPPERYLMERFITAPVWFGGQAGGGERAALQDGQMKPAPGYRPRLRLVSLDIETTAHGDLYSIALEGCGQRQVYMLGPPNGSDEPLDFDLAYCENHPQMLEQLNRWLERHDPDAIIGWNLVQFDLRILQRHAERHQDEPHDEKRRRHGHHDAPGAAARLPAPHSARMALIGSTRMALRVGSTLAAILRLSGYPVLTATYVNDIGPHVIKCLWCYRSFHQGAEPATGRGRWLGHLYAEAELRLLPPGSGCLACVGGFAQGDRLLPAVEEHEELPEAGQHARSLRGRRLGRAVIGKEDRGRR